MGQATGFDSQILMCNGPLNMSCYGLRCRHWHQEKKQDQPSPPRQAANNAQQLAKQKQIHWYQNLVLLHQLQCIIRCMPRRKRLTLLPAHKQQFLRIVVTESIWTGTAWIGMPSAIAC